MATIDIGKLTFTHKGDYDGSTAYVLNDVVYYNGSAYIAKTSTTGNLPTSTAHWNQFSAGSGGIWNSGLSLGTAGQIVKVNSGASALEFGTISSDYVRIVTAAGDGTAVLDLDSCFSSTYENYRIVANIHTSTATNVNIRLQDASNSEITSEYYYTGTQNYRNSSTAGTDVKSGWNQGFWQPQESIGAETDGFGTINLEVARPFVNNRFTNMNIRYTTYDGSTFRQVDSYCQNRSTSMQQAGIRFYVTSGNITSNSTVSVYGLKNS